MTTNPTSIPEPTSLNTVVVGKRDGKAAVAMKMSRHRIYPWLLRGEDGSFISWGNWTDLRALLTDIRVVDATEVAAQIGQLKARIAELEADKPEPGPWLHGAELAAVMPTLKAGVVVEVEHDGHRATGELWAGDHGFLSLWAYTIRTTTGKPGPYLDALRIIERAPEPKPDWAGDQVVMVKFRKHSGGGWKVARRSDDGEWITRDDVNGRPTDLLAERFEVRRLSPEAHAELLTIVRSEKS